MSGTVLGVLKKGIENAVAGKDVAIAFSGGLDSGLVSFMSKKYAKSVKLYVVGTEKSHDVAESAKTAEQLNLELAIINPEDVDKNIREMCKLTGTTDPVTVSFELPLFYVCKNCEEDIILTGQGADEVFAGYSKYENLNENDFFKIRNDDLKKLFDVTLKHEKTVSEKFGKEIVYPYLEKELIETVSKIKIEELMPKNLRKEILREVASSVGLNELAAKKKKAAQYGSGINEIIKKEAKKKNMSMGDYVRWLSDDRKR